MSNASVKILIAGGKTGGHLFPGIAVALALQELAGADILFVGTGSEFESATLDRYGFDHTCVTVSGIKGRGIWGKLTSGMKLPLSLCQAISILFRFRPDLVLGVGGYSSGPVVIAASLLGVKTAIQEQNSIPGMTNRILSRFADVIFTSFERTRGFEANPKVMYTGNPIRRQVPSVSQAGPDRQAHRFTLLVTGGSQGAASINKAVLKAVSLLEHPDTMEIIHQTGPRDEAFVNEHYISLGIKATVGKFFHDMPELMAAADLIICRAGAGTLSEITCLGKPSILIPYPFAADDHQRFNAEALVDAGAAWMILDGDLSGEKLKTTIESARNHPEVLAAMAGAATQMGRPGADKTIARKCLELAGWEDV